MHVVDGEGADDAVEFVDGAWLLSLEEVRRNPPDILCSNQMLGKPKTKMLKKTKIPAVPVPLYLPAPTPTPLPPVPLTVLFNRIDKLDIC